MKENFDKYLQQCPAVAILRGIKVEEVCAVCETLYNAGIRVLEVPLNTPNAFEAIKIAADNFQDKMAIGAGTVLTPEDVRQVKASGGTFIVSPNTDTDVIRETKAQNMVSIPGFYTVTEGFAAARAGADYLKLFPASIGVGYIKDIQAVLKTPILAVGGVTAENIPDFMKLCRGVGIGSFIYKSGKSLDDIRSAAEAVVKSVMASS